MQVQSDKWCPIYPPPWKTPPSWNLSLRRELNRGIHKLATVVVRRWSHLLSRHVACTISLLRCVYGFDAYLAYSWNSKSKIRHNTLKPRCLPHFWHSEMRPSLTFFVSHTADLALSTLTVSRRLRWAVQQFLSRVSTLTLDIDIAILSVRPSVRLSVTFRYQMKTA